MPRRAKRMEEWSARYLRKLKKRCPADSSSDNSIDASDGSDNVGFNDENSCSASETVTVEGGNQAVQGDNSTSESSSDENGVFQENQVSACCPNRVINEEAVLDEEVTEDSSDDSDDDCPAEDNEAFGERNEPLYEGAPITVAESQIVIMAMVVRHRLNLRTFEDLLKLVALHCPPENKCTTTVYKFNKKFQQINIPVVRHYYCSVCYQRIEDARVDCRSCMEQTKKNYFVAASIPAQLKILFKRPGFRDSLNGTLNRRRPPNRGEYTDIYDGAVYSKLCETNGFLNDPKNISFTMYTDGIRIFRSSSLSIWPIYLVINELPYSIRFRQENILLASLWSGEEKPLANLFLMPLMETARELREGIEVQDSVGDIFTVKGIIMCFTADLPATASMYNMKQHNGKFGCQICTQKGEFFQRGVRVYPYEPFNLRTDEGTDEHAREASLAGVAVCGVKGPTAMKYIVHKYIEELAVDIMHCGIEGVTDDTLNFFFDPKFRDHPASICNAIEAVNERLLSVNPPSFVQRIPRSIEDHIKIWKGHEIKLWLLFYSIPCLKGILPEEYFQHYLLLVLGVSLLSLTIVTPENVGLASRALNEYVGRFEHLYGRRYMSSNLHHLLHLPEIVRRFGPLWTTSCFPFEDLNGKIKHLVHGSNSVHLQIFSATSKFINMTALKHKHLREGGLAEKFCERMSSKFGRMKRFRIANEAYIVGKCTEKTVPPDIAEVFRSHNINGLKNFTYKRLLKNKILYSSVEYERSRKTDSSFAVYLAHDGSRKIGRIKVFVRTTNCDCRRLCECLACDYAIIQPCILEKRILSNILNCQLENIHNLVDFRDTIVAVDIWRIQSVCFHLKIEGTLDEYVVETVNCMEFE